MENQLNVGDVVVLKSDGPKMTVNAVGEKVHCIWFDKEKSEFRADNFNPKIIKLYKSSGGTLR